jgi:pimeloyl-ACP methyl ester carboxylesterase
VSLLRHRGGSGPPLLLLHGLGLTWRCWLPVLDALQACHDTIALDLPGFGDAPPLRRPTPTALTDAVARALSELGVEAPAVVGNSLGGWIGLELARRGLASRVVAIAPSGLESPPERAYIIAMNEMMRARAKLNAPLGRLATWPAPNRTFLFSGLRGRPWRVDAQDGARELHSFGYSPGFQPTLRWTIGTTAALALHQIRVPVRVLVGTADLMLGPLTGPRFVAALPDAELVVLPRLGHVPMNDDPDAVARAILTFTRPA